MFQRPNQPDIITDFVIIGAGPAGIFTAIELRKKGKEVWILGSPYESQLAKAGPLNQVTSIPEGTIGLDYMEELIGRAKELGVNHKSSLCTEIIPGDTIAIKTKYQNFIANSVIIATGAKQAKLGFEGEKKFLHKGISDCTVCDFGLFRGKTIAVLGNHEYTIRASKFMIPHVEKIYLLWFNEQLSEQMEVIEAFDEVGDLEAFGEETLQGVRFSSKHGNQELKLDGLFVEGQPIPSSGFLKGSGVELDEFGYVIINENYETNVKSIFSVGDVTGKTHSYDTVVAEVASFIATHDGSN